MPYGKELTKQWKKLGYLDSAFWPRPRPPRRSTAAPSPRPSFPGGALSRRAAPPRDLPPPAAARKRRQAVAAAAGKNMLRDEGELIAEGKITDPDKIADYRKREGLTSTLRETRARRRREAGAGRRGGVG